MSKKSSNFAAQNCFDFDEKRSLYIMIVNRSARAENCFQFGNLFIEDSPSFIEVALPPTCEGTSL